MAVQSVILVFRFLRAFMQRLMNCSDFLFASFASDTRVCGAPPRQGLVGPYGSRAFSIQPRSLLAWWKGLETKFPCLLLTPILFIAAVAYALQSVHGNVGAAVRAGDASRWPGIQEHSVGAKRMSPTQQNPKIKKSIHSLPRYGLCGWNQMEVGILLSNLGLPADSPLSALAVEVLLISSLRLILWAPISEAQEFIAHRPWNLLQKFAAARTNY